MTQQMKQIYTLGYENSKWDIIKAILFENEITHLIDIRRHNHYKSTFSRSNLEKMCNDLDIVYLHEPDFAPSEALLQDSKNIIKAIKKREPKENRRFMIQSYYRNEFRSKYLAEIEERNCDEKLMELISSMERPCFISAAKYRDINIAYRKMIFDHILESKRIDVRIIHHHENFYQIGHVHNLRGTFRYVNETYFDGKIKPSEIVFTWSTRLPGGEYRFFFGVFCPPNTILMNAKLDTPVVPEFIINGVFYHELNHYVRFRDGLPYDHTVPFYIQDLDFKDTAKHFHYMRDFFREHLPEIYEEIGLHKTLDIEDEKLNQFFGNLERILTQGESDDK